MISQQKFETSFGKILDPFWSKIFKTKFTQKTIIFDFTPLCWCNLIKIVLKSPMH